ncbi:MAG: phosphate ABC transporter permease subunit PstC [Hyphomicrobium sp.]|jgi:phosphate transport system permease protein
MVAQYFLLLALLVISGYFFGSLRARSVAGGNFASMHSLPEYHGLYTAALVLAPMLFIFAVGLPSLLKVAEASALGHFPADLRADPLKSSATLRDIMNLASGGHSGAVAPELQDAAKTYSDLMSRGGWLILGLGLSAGLCAISWGVSSVSMSFRARNNFERFVNVALLLAASIAVLTTIGIVSSVMGETYRFFFDPNIKGKPGVFDFLFGTEWNPQAAMRADQGEISTAYGFLPLLTGTLLITCIAIAVAGPLGLFSAIYLAEYASPKVRATAKPILEILAGVPTVVLGFFAALTVAPFVRGWGEYFGLNVASESALAAGLVMGMMIIPFISSLSDDVINSVPQSLRDGAYALGATKSETIKQVILPAALPGIVSAFMLAISRAIGETMIVVMAAGLASNLTFNPLEAVTTITVQIKTILVGDQEFDSAKTLAAFALGFVLFFVTLLLNFIALRVVQKYREQYD